MEDAEEIMDTEVQDDLYQLVSFKLAEEEYAFKITDIQEVIHVQAIRGIPQMPEFILGVINLRGNVISVFDLRKKLHLPAKEFDDKTKIVVTKVDDTIISLVVDEIMENITLTQSQVEPAPNVKMKINKECIAGLGKLKGKLITILNLEKIHEEIIADVDINVEV